MYGQKAGILGVQHLIQVTYAELTSLISSSGLIAGVFYEITNYRTRHVIPTTVSTIHTGAIEPITVLALSSNQIDNQAWSKSYPQDLLEYDYSSNVCEDSITPRTGKITYRKDTTKNLSTHYDFREVTYYRYTPDTSLFPTWTTATGYVAGQIVFETVSGSLWLCRENHTSGVFLADELILYWVNVNQLIFQKFTTPVISVMGGTVYCNPTPVQVKTFTNLVLPGVYDCSNISIGGLDTFSNVSGIYYNNIFIESSSDIIIGENCTNMSFTSSGPIGPCDGNKIGNNCSNIFINGSRYNIIGNRNIGFYLSNMCHSNTFGNENVNVYGQEGGRWNVVGNLNTTLYFSLYSEYTSIGSGNTSLMFITSSISNSVGSNCSNFALFSSGGNSIENNCTGFKFKYSLFNSFGNSCASINSASTTGGYGVMDSNSFGNGCTSITIGTQCTFLYNRLGNQCSYFTLIEAVMVNNNFGNSCAGFILTGPNIQFIGNTFLNSCNNFNILATFTLVSSLFGNGCSSFSLSNGTISACSFGNSNGSFTVTDSSMSGTVFGSNFNTFSLTASSSCTSNFIGSGCGQFTIINTPFSNNIIGNSCLNWSFTNNQVANNIWGSSCLLWSATGGGTIVNNKIASSCSNFTFNGSCSFSSNTIEPFFSVMTLTTCNFEFNNIGNRSGNFVCNNASVVRNNKFGNRVDTFTVSASTTVENSTFGNSCTAITVSSLMSRSQFCNGFSNTTISGSLIGVMLNVYTTLTNTITGNYVDRVVNFYSPNGTYWATTVDNLGSMSTSTLT